MVALRPLAPELAKKAQVELGEVPSRLDKDVKCLRDWIQKQPHLCNRIRTDDQWLVTFLRGCKYSLEKTKKKIDLYYSAKACFPEFNSGVDPNRPEILTILKAGYIIPLITTRVKLGEPEPIFFKVDSVVGIDFDVVDIFRVLHMIFSIFLKEHDNMIISGNIIIIDLGGNVSSLIPHFTVQQVKKVILLGEDSCPLRSKETHFINVSTKWEPFIKFVKLFMNEKSKNRLIFHRDASTLKDYISSAYLPKEFGGENETLDELRAFWKDKVLDHANYFIEDMNYKADESRRPKDSKGCSYETTNTLIGTAGSFRELQID